MFKRMGILMIVAGFSIVLVSSTLGVDHWGKWDDGDVYMVTILDDDDEEFEYSVKEPEITSDGSRLYFNNNTDEPSSGSKMDLFVADETEGEYGIDYGPRAIVKSCV